MTKATKKGFLFAESLSGPGFYPPPHLSGRTTRGGTFLKDKSNFFIDPSNKAFELSGLLINFLNRQAMFFFLVTRPLRLTPS